MWHPSSSHAEDESQSGNTGDWFLQLTDLYLKTEVITNGGQMEFDHSRNLSSFSSTNDLNLSPSRKRTITKGKTINPHEELEPCHSATTTSMVTQSTVSCQTRRNAFYCLNNNEEVEDEKPPTGSSNLLVEHGMEHAYQKFFGKKTKESLSSFLTHLPGLIDVPGTPSDGLQALINKPPIGGKELVTLSGHQLAGFRLNPGAVPDQFKFVNQQPSKKKHKHKKHKKEHSESKTEEKPKTQEGPAEKKSKKSKKHEDGDKKKKKKEKRKKKDKTDTVT